MQKEVQLLVHCWTLMAALLAIFLIGSFPAGVRGQFCPTTGSYVEGNIQPTNIAEYIDDLDMELCNATAEHRCFECSEEIEGIMIFSAACAINVTGTNSMTCSNPGLQPCASPNDTDCRPMQTAITGMTKCNFSLSENGEILSSSSSSVYCNDTCGLAEVQDGKRRQVLMSCSKHCRTWMRALESSFPDAKVKFCDASSSNKSCDIKGPRILAPVIEEAEATATTGADAPRGTGPQFQADEAFLPNAADQLRVSVIALAMSTSLILMQHGCLF